ncbi:hypothetical protein B0J11DRAFT_181741 [Dendryphion nanum]|uniref:Uncharacterized protein n=1 Tax=Dendryphion nanum TaxID=256645 RepID=A0A9P9IAS1_9PLEO|nr:hypothetical protein B0J11DRAFT_181741 [Dendryphion nanum]
MKLNAILFTISSATAAVITSRQGNNAVQRGAQTLVLRETNGVPGNECLTFRNNGEIVDAACVNEAADRQLTPSTLAASSSSVLLVQRSFSNGFRPDLVNKQACVGFNGTTFLAQDCANANLDPVSFQNGQLVSASGACQSGHDSKAQLTVDPAGQNCAGLTSTTVRATAP